jgi:hypothetical protein
MTGVELRDFESDQFNEAMLDLTCKHKVPGERQ